ncbi:MAG: prepilin-type N-terminal cleavage/methylation domain-containing protein [Phycisphaerales bacterium]
MKSRKTTRESSWALGFTLLELLVVVALVALIIALLLPAVSAMRNLSLRTQTLSAMRQLVQAVSLYSFDFDGSFPYYGVPGDPAAPLTFNGSRRPTSIPLHLVHHSEYWASGVRPYLSGAPQTSMGPAVRPLAEEIDGLYFSPFRMSMTCFTDAEFWQDSQRGFRTIQIVGNKQQRIRWPARKVVLSAPDLHAAQASERSVKELETWFAAMADGSVTHTQWLGPDRNVIPSFIPSVVTYPYWFGSATTDGIDGVDIR